MKNKTLIFVALSLITLLITSGCASIWKNTYTAPTYFDIGTPSFKTDNSASRQIELITVKTSTPYNEYMVFRQSETHLEIDSYNCWASSPDDMLKQYLILGFNQGLTNKIETINPNRFQLNITILRLEANLVSKQAVMALQIEIFDSSTTDKIYSELFLGTEQMQTVTGQNFSVAIKAIADRMILKVDSDLNAVPLQPSGLPSK